MNDARRWADKGFTASQLVEILDEFRKDTPVVIEASGLGEFDVSEIHTVQKAIGTDGREEVHLIAADGVKNRHAT